MNASDQARGGLPLRLIVILSVVIMGALLVALQSFGPAIGVTRYVGL